MIEQVLGADELSAISVIKGFERNGAGPDVFAYTGVMNLNSFIPFLDNLLRYI